MKLADMKMSDEEAKEQYGPSSAMADSPQYPYGLQLSLDEESLAKIGIKDLPAVGTKVQITAIAEVTSVSKRKNRGGDDESNASLQIIQMGIEAAPSEEESPDVKLYGGGKDKSGKAGE